ncbi:WD domain-containing protein [Rutstroemia sp. NJR-2017a WRK4]|nr:WD domain-containing protein [Rutstroemia sp. NJR-2017a WRK4]
MPSSPRTPHHSRHSSAYDFAPSSPNNTGMQTRRLSKTSIHTPSTPNHLVRDFSHNEGVGMGIDVLQNAQNGANNGLGNLADELADAWSDDEEGGEIDMNFQQSTSAAPSETEETPNIQAIQDSGVDVSSPTKALRQRESMSHALNLTPPPMGGRGHARMPSEYDGSDYGGDSDLESPAPGISAALQARMDMVEGLARRGTENNGGQADGVVKRVIEGLRDLGGQSGVEGNATRLITAHTALSTHLLHQTRLIQSLSHPLFSPLSTPPTPEITAQLLPLLTSLSDSIPRPTTPSLTSLTALHTLTSDLIQTINYLSDTLHMSRQTTITANRKLKSAKELVAEMRREEELREEGERWVEEGGWEERLRGRESAKVCRGVVGGFEEVCEGWRRRLVESAGVEGGG